MGLQRNIISSVSLSLSLVLVSITYNGCSDFYANPDVVGEKLMFISKAKIFATQSGDAEQYFSTKPPGPGEPVNEMPAQPSPLNNTVAANSTVSVTNVCSNAMTSARGFNLKSAVNPTLHVQSLDGQNLCTFDANEARSRIISLRSLNFQELARNCPNLVAGDYYLALSDGGKPGNILVQSDNIALMYSHGDHRPQFNLAPSGRYSLKSSEKIMVLVDTIEGSAAPREQWNSNSIRALAAENPSPNQNETPEDCDVRASPLMVQISDGISNRPIRLTPPTHGIFFDIFGQNTSPPHSKTRISWYADSASASYNYWIVLPSSNQVHGVDQMFGDNTKGPDGTFATNGFEALRKWDGRTNYFDEMGSYFSPRLRDGKIDERDYVFSNLQLWFDRNLDGVSQPDELIGLKQAGVEYIDLNYDPNFAETDIFGNEVKFKSVMRMRDGRLNIVYDLWFRKI